MISPSINNAYASQSFSGNLFYGAAPIFKTTQIDVEAPLTAADYVNGALLAYYATDPSKFVLYDSTDTDQIFIGVMFDEMANASTIENGWVQYAVAESSSTMWYKSALVGVNSGSTDIDALIADGKAVVIPNYEAGEYIPLVKFQAIGG